MKEESFAFQQSPATWIEEADIEALTFQKATWIPLVVERVDLQRGELGTVGYRRTYRDIDSIIVPSELRDGFKDVDWQSVSRNNSDSAWADDEGFRPPGCYYGDSRVLYPVIQRSFDTGEQKQWNLLQELEVGLRLLHRGDVWICPEENDVEVAKIERDEDGNPHALLFRAEYLRDYLCARKAALLLTGFVIRDAVEEEFAGLAWKTDRHERKFAHGEWEGTRSAIHEGGHPFGMETAVLHMWRESVNPEDDVPEMPHPCAEPAAKSESFVSRRTERKLIALCGTIWVKHWIEPAAQSPRIRRDEVESRIHFQVENQEQKTLAGKALEEYRGWLWFESSVIRRLLSEPKSCLRWYTADTGEIGPAQNRMLHFGVNKLGLINVLGYKMAGLPEWAQKMWVTHNIGPDGGLSEELHMSQNLARPARTIAPERMLWNNLNTLQARTNEVYGQTILQRIPDERDFYRRVHRFFSSSFEEVCELCKELHRIVSEPIDIGLLNSIVDPENAAAANSQKLRQIKRFALWLDTRGINGREVTRALAGVADLRQGDAHAGGRDLRESLGLLGIPVDADDYQRMCFWIIGQVANCIGMAAEAVPVPQETT